MYQSHLLSLIREKSRSVDWCACVWMKEISMHYSVKMVAAEHILYTILPKRCCLSTKIITKISDYLFYSHFVLSQDLLSCSPRLAWELLSLLVFTAKRLSWKPVPDILPLGGEDPLWYFAWPWCYSSRQDVFIHPPSVAALPAEENIHMCLQCLSASPVEDNYCEVYQQPYVLLFPSLLLLGWKFFMTNLAHLNRSKWKGSGMAGMRRNGKQHDLGQSLLASGRLCRGHPWLPDKSSHLH